MIQHHYNIWQWIHFHFAEISLLWLPAFLFYLRAFVDSCKVAGYTKLADRLGKFELFLTTFVSETKIRQTTKTIAVFFICLGFAFISGCAPLSIYKAGCGDLASTKNTVPYTFGTLDASGNGCYLIFYGKGPANFEPIKTMMTTYMTTSKPNTLVTSDGSTVMVIPPTKK